MNQFPANENDLFLLDDVTISGVMSVLKQSFFTPPQFNKAHTKAMRTKRG